MRKASMGFLAGTVLLCAAGALLRRLELSAVVGTDGLAVFKPVTAVLLALSVLAAAGYVLFASRTAEKLCSVPYTSAFRPATWAPVALSAVCLIAYLLGAWELFQQWKARSHAVNLVLACMGGLCGAGWLYLRLEEKLNRKHGGAQLLAGFLVTLFCCFWLVMYYRDYAPVPSLIVTLYGFLALCAATVASYSFAGGSAGKLRVRRCLALCGIGAYLCVVAFAGETGWAFRLFFGATAVQLVLTGLLLLSPLPVGEESEEPGTPNNPLVNILAALPLEKVLGRELFDDVENWTEEPAEETREPETEALPVTEASPEAEASSETEASPEDGSAPEPEAEPEAKPEED